MPQLTPEEIDRLLAGPVTARLATVRPDGAPYVVPIWQQWDGERLLMVARERARFIEHLVHEPRVAVSCADDVDPAHPRVLFEGRADIIEGPALMSGRMLAVAREMAERYGGPDGLRYLDGTMDQPRYLLQVVPERTTTWVGSWHSRYRV